MLIQIHLSAITLLLFTKYSLAQFIVDGTPITAVSQSPAERRNPAPAPLDGLEDAPGCITEDITRYFNDAPKPTGRVGDAITSYENNDVTDYCSKIDNVLYCGFRNTQKWCSFTTSAPAEIVKEYSSGYFRSVTSFWAENSESISRVSTSCPVSWSQLNLFSKGYHVSMASILAECYSRNGTIGPDPVTVDTASGELSTRPRPGFDVPLTSGATITAPTPLETAGISPTATSTASTSAGGSVRSGGPHFVAMIMGLFAFGGYLLV